MDKLFYGRRVSELSKINEKEQKIKFIPDHTRDVSPNNSNGLKSVATISPVPSGTSWYFIDLYRIIFISEILITAHIIHKTNTKKSRRLDQNCRAGIYSRPTISQE